MQQTFLNISIIALAIFSIHTRLKHKIIAQV